MQMNATMRADGFHGMGAPLTCKKRRKVKDQNSLHTKKSKRDRKSSGSAQTGSVLIGPPYTDNELDDDNSPTKKAFLDAMRNMVLFHAIHSVDEDLGMAGGQFDGGCEIVDGSGG